MVIFIKNRSYYMTDEDFELAQKQERSLIRGLIVINLLVQGLLWALVGTISIWAILTLRG